MQTTRRILLFFAYLVFYWAVFVIWDDAHYADTPSFLLTILFAVPAAFLTAITLASALRKTREDIFILVLLIGNMIVNFLFSLLAWYDYSFSEVIAGFGAFGGFGIFSILPIYWIGLVVIRVISGSKSKQNTFVPNPSASASNVQSPWHNHLLGNGESMLSRLIFLHSKIPNNDFRALAQTEKLINFTKQIFLYIRNHPAAAGKIKTFLDYYLPTSLKLLESYIEYQDKAEKVDNVRDILRKISDMLDTVSMAFENQLNNLYSDKVLDLDLDMKVLQDIMEREGLS